MYQIVIGANEEICANCKYFHPHYIKSGEKFMRLRDGHCAYRRLKARDVFQSCDKFELNEEEHFTALQFEEVRG